MWIYYVIGIYLVVVIILTVIGGKRNIGYFMSFILSLLLTPLIGGIFVLKSEKPIKYYESRYVCDRCKYEFTDQRDYCPYCRKDGHEVNLRMKRTTMT